MANDHLCLKTLNTLVKSVQNRKIPTKSAVFYRLFFGEVSPESVSENPTIFDFFWDLSEAL